jgi:prepilin-type N-terminal cleavage/methylation domain-containing protein
MITRQEPARVMIFPRDTTGFTLLELILVVAIISILALIAMRQFTEYRLQAMDARAATDLRNAATAEEAYFVGARAYKTGSDTGPGPSSFLAGLMVSETVTLTMTALGPDRFSGVARSDRGSGKVFSYDNLAGGMQ